ncbi:hypothetical protein EYR38_003331 [Pleurotus pulmonarius]|nr:hypothetical protein EYR38_003331 [Pleurotus pulmonarius]
MTGRSRTPSPTRIVHSTPALRKVSTKKPFDVAVAPVEEVKADMARETQGYWIGPCPTEHFFDSMNAPSSDDDSSPAQPDIPATYFKEMNVTCEKDIYKAIVVLANGEGDHPPLLPEHTLVDTSNHSDPNAELGAKIRTDLGHYWNGVVSKKHPTLLDLMLIAYEVKKSHNEDIVNDTMECTISCPHDCECPYEITNPTATRIRGQLANYATQICRRQHRTHFYMVFIFHPFVRFIRWDRAGAIVTRRVNYVEDCTPLVRFLYLFGRLDRAGQGLDPTTRPASQAEAKKAKRYLKREWDAGYDHTVDGFDDYEEYTPIAHEDMEAVWITALESHSWPRDDGAVDQVELARQLSFKVPNEPLERTNTKRQDPPEPKEEDEQEESLRGAKRRKT